ncbi:MAG: Oligo alginate lyase [Siphoviridae sp. ctCJE6]|nr:MAG: Oligo alginate lyase [Siphoviridae sp. ctCJE6]
MLKKFLILFFVMSLAVPAFAGKVGMSDAQLAIWQQMKNENHPLYQRMAADAAKTNLYEDLGLRPGLMYLLTGDAAWASAAFSRVKGYRGRTINTGGMQPTRNQTRHEFVTMSVLYDWIKDGLSSSDRARFRDILDYWCDLVIADVNHGTRISDSDETTGHYFGVMLYALSLKSEDPARSQELINHQGKSYVESGKTKWISRPMGGFDASSLQGGYTTWRDGIAMFCTRSAGGEWLESSNYNIGTMQYLITGIIAINENLGVDKFPECTSMAGDFAQDLVFQTTPDVKDSFQWGDTQNPRDLNLFRRIGVAALISGATKNPLALWLFDRLWAKNGTTNVPPHWILGVDPYAPRRAPLPGEAFHIAAGMGTGYYHAGWGDQDSFFAAIFKPWTGVDHQTSMFTNFGLYRKGRWKITNPRGYYGAIDAEAPYQNTMLIHGALPYMDQETRMMTGGAGGAGVLVLSGKTGGLPYKDNNPPVTMREWQRTYVYKHADSGDDLILVVDNVDADNPMALSDAQRGKFKATEKFRIESADGKHQWVIHMPEAPQINGPDISWMDGGERVYLRSYINGFTTEVIDFDQSPGWGGNFKSGERKYQLRIIPNADSGKQVFVNLLKIGSPITQSDYEQMTQLYDGNIPPPEDDQPPPDDEPPPDGLPVYGVPVLTAVNFVNEGYYLSWVQPESQRGYPDGGFDVWVDGVDTNDVWRTDGLTQVITGLDASVEHRFLVESRYVADNVFFQSEEITIPPVVIFEPPGDDCDCEEVECSIPSPKRLTATEFRNNLADCYERAMLGDPCEIFHNTYREIFILKRQ